MKAILYFLVKVENGYNNQVELSNGLKMTVNNSIESVENINRTGEIISAPKGTIVNKGDQLLFHHNICRESFGYKSKRRKSSFLVRDNIYYVPATEVFMLKRKDSKQWEAIDPYVFIKPIKAEVKTLSNGLKVKEDDYKGMKDLVGTVAFPNKVLEYQGVNKGDTVAFREYSQHEFSIDGEIYYKMKTQDILGVI